MNTQQRGFTLVELFIIIALLGILVTIGTFGWGAVTKSSQNNTRATELKQWAGSFELFKSKYAYYPGMPTSNGTVRYCLGTFTKTNNKCGEYTQSDARMLSATSAKATEIITELQKVGKVPEGTVPAIGGVAIGPYVQFTHTGSSPSATVTAKFVALIDGTSCPGDTTAEIQPGFSPVAASLSGVKTCTITKTLTY